MNLDELRSVQNAERRKSGLQSLRESFYEEAGEYVASLKHQRERAADRAEDPFSDPEVKRLSDEIETAEEVIEAIYERRMGKLLKRASLAASEMSADEEGLTAEERELFHAIVERIRENKTAVLDTVSGDVDSPPDDGELSQATDSVSAEDSPEPAGDDSVSAADAMGSAAEPDAGSVDPVGNPDLTAGDGETAADNDPVPPGESPSPDRHPEADAPTPGSGGSGGSSGGGDADEDATTGSDRVTVRITRDVGEIFGVDDRQYDLASEDVVQLPEQNADPLLKRDAAERLE